MFLSRIRGGRNPEFPILDKWSHTHNAKDVATVYNATRGGASVRGKQELSVRGKGKIYSMWEKADLCTTWKVFYCLYVEKTLCLHNVEN